MSGQRVEVPKRSEIRRVDAKPREAMMRVLASLLCAFSVVACATQESQYRWTQFVHVAGQPEPVPVEWVSTVEGKFAHSIRIPNPVPQDSGYRSTMSSNEYFDHLCKTEAGEFVFKTASGVEGLYLMRPPTPPTDYDMMDRYKLEAPPIERLFPKVVNDPASRSGFFVFPGDKSYQFMEEPLPVRSGRTGFVRAYGYRDMTTPRPVEVVESLRSKYGLTWRGLRRPADRENGIAGGEWLVVELNSGVVRALVRDYSFTGFTRNKPEGIWWLNSLTCSNLRDANAGRDGQQLLRQFVQHVLVPAQRETLR